MQDIEISQFSDNFWGNKNNGFHVLYHNMKHGQESSKEFSDFLRESCTVVESYAKLLAKLSKITNNYGLKGSFGPFWTILHNVVEQLSGVHTQLVTSWQELIKEVHTYSDEQHRKYRAMKESEANTMETVQSLQQTILLLHKSREAYHQRCNELKVTDKLRKDNKTVTSNNKDIEKMETKAKKAHDEYKNLVDKYATIRQLFEERMIESSKRFQSMEENHLEKLQGFAKVYQDGFSESIQAMNSVDVEFRQSRDELCTAKLLEMFVRAKSTGCIKPGPIEFIDVDMSGYTQRASTPADLLRLSPLPNGVNSSAAKSTVSINDFPILEKPKGGASGFLSKRKKLKKKIKIEKDNKSISSGSPGNKEPVVDTDGYTVRQNNIRNDNEEVTNWYSSSDSDSDTEEKRKIKVEIKPVESNRSSASNVEELRKTVEGLRLSPTVNKRATPTMKYFESSMKKSASVSETLTKPSHDLLGLDLFHASPISATFSPQLNSSNLLSSPMDSTMSPMSPHLHNYSFDSNAIQHAESLSSINFSISSVNSFSEVPQLEKIPVAVAISEVVNASFIGHDQSKCKLKRTGELAMSFPSSIIHLLDTNISLDQIVFRLNNTADVQDFLPNDRLIKDMTEDGVKDSKTYCFLMNNLIQILKLKSQQSKNASYHNIKLLKYQLNVPSRCTQAMPLQCAYDWSANDNVADFRMNYRLNSASLVSDSRIRLSRISIGLNIEGPVKSLMYSTPTAEWCEETKSTKWQVPDLYSSGSERQEELFLGVLRSKYELLTSGAELKPNPAHIRFCIEGATMSGLEFELLTSSYKTSLIKKIVTTGKYTSER